MGSHHVHTLRTSGFLGHPTALGGTSVLADSEVYGTCNADTGGAFRGEAACQNLGAPDKCRTASSSVHVFICPRISYTQVF